MTVAVAWVRKQGLTEQLWFASDSRLSGGRNIDYAPKIMPLSRKDSAISFGGDTDIAFPLMIQLSHAVEHYSPARERALDIVEIKTHTLKIFDNMIAKGLYSDIKELKREPVAQFILGGYSWRKKRYQLWEIGFNKTEQRFQAWPACAVKYAASRKMYGYSRDTSYLRRNRGQVAFAGDKGKETQRRLAAMLADRDADRAGAISLDMEPFEVVRDMLRESGRYDSIGGAPQLVRVDEHINTRPVGVYWPNAKSKNLTVLGRPALAYENLDVWALDPDTLKLHHPQFAPVEEALKELAGREY